MKKLLVNPFHFDVVSNKLVYIDIKYEAKHKAFAFPKHNRQHNLLIENMYHIDILID